MPNRLKDATSPYLLQHKNNPVDWFPWCDDAFEQARADDKPIFLSVGYSACHWCHVMERESFEDEKLAALLNEYFISIKVDREERPDVDQIYMQAVQMLSGSGGWPMSVFMSADGKPFFGGTYWPPDSRWGRPGFGQVLLAVRDAWLNKREQISAQSIEITEHLDSACRGPQVDNAELDASWIDQAERGLLDHFDRQFGGFGSAPKFPHAMELSLLIERECASSLPARMEAIERTIDCMHRGGIYDHLGGGFARYSVDEKWLVPHFEKMLYDNALLSAVYADAYRLTGNEHYSEVLRETLGYVLRDMTNALGGFFSAEDADSEGVEGKFYVWTVEEIHEHLGIDAELFSDVYDVTAAGNFEGASILNLRDSLNSVAERVGLSEDELRAKLVTCRQSLLRVRDKRIRPALDDKALLSWNALMIRGLVHGYRALHDERYLNAAVNGVQFIVDQMSQGDGTLWHTWRNGQASIDAFLDDYAYLIDAICELFQVYPCASYIELAQQLAEILMSRFLAEDGGFYFTSTHHEALIARSKDVADSSVPSGNAMAASGLLTLGRLTSDARYIEAAGSALRALAGVMSRSPAAAGQALRVLERFQSVPVERILVSNGRESESDRLFLQVLEPNAIHLRITTEQISDPKLQQVCPLLRERDVVQGQTTLYHCVDSTCFQPIVGEKLYDHLKGLHTHDV